MKNKGIFASFNVMLTALIISLLIPSCAVNPVTGKKELSLISTAQEIEMGKAYDPQVVASFGLYEDQTMQNFIEKKGQEMAAISHRPNLAYEFKILDSPVVNAFAVPGGFVYFTRGIMAHFNNEAEFAGVLGHEIGHITARHTVKQQSRATLAQLGLIAGVIASKEVAQYADVAQQSLGLLFLKFGRDAESQSDRLGVEYSTKIGYDAREMADFFQTLKRLSDQSGQSIPTFLSTHPDPADRYNKVGQLADKWQNKLNGQKEWQVNRNNYLKMIDGLVYGEDPRQGYVDDNKFFHPELKFEFPIPAGWRHQNSPSSFQMAPENGKAMMALTLAQGQNPEAAAQSFVTENKLTLVESRNTTVNGLQAVMTISEQPAQTDQSGQQTQALTVQTYHILYNNLVYQLLGVATKNDFRSYQRDFNNTMQNFRRLTNPSRINVKPEVIEIETVRSTTSLRNALNSFKMPADRHEELAILNGMQLDDQVPGGTMIKVVGKQK